MQRSCAGISGDPSQRWCLIKVPTNHHGCPWQPRFVSCCGRPFTGRQLLQSTMTPADVLNARLVYWGGRGMSFVGSDNVYASKGRLRVKEGTQGDRVLY